MINFKNRDQIYRVGDVNYLRGQSGGFDLNVGNVTYISGSGGDDATVTFAHSSSAAGVPYIKFTIGASTSTAMSTAHTAAKYYFWDTGFKSQQCPSICITMDSSGSNEADMVTEDNDSEPTIVYGFCWWSGSAVPILPGTDGSGDGTYPNLTTPINRWVLHEHGNGANLETYSAGGAGDISPSYNTAQATGNAAGCRGMRSKFVAATQIRADTSDPSGTPLVEAAPLYYYMEWFASYPNTDCDGDQTHQNHVTTGDAIPPGLNLYVFVAAGNGRTGGGANTYAANFKVRIF